MLLRYLLLPVVLLRLVLDQVSEGLPLLFPLLLGLLLGFLPVRLPLLCLA